MPVYPAPGLTATSSWVVPARCYWPLRFRSPEVGSWPWWAGGRSVERLPGPEDWLHQNPRLRQRGRPTRQSGRLSASRLQQVIFTLREPSPEAGYPGWGERSSIARIDPGSKRRAQFAASAMRGAISPMVAV
jgi:hypothetical protein